MKTWKQFVILNFGALSGIIVSLFIVPGNTPLWEWALVSLVVVAIFNGIFYMKGRGSSMGEKRPNSRLIFWASWAGLLLLIVDALISRLHR